MRNCFHFFGNCQTFYTFPRKIWSWLSGVLENVPVMSGSEAYFMNTVFIKYTLLLEIREYTNTAKWATVIKDIFFRVIFQCNPNKSLAKTRSCDLGNWNGFHVISFVIEFSFKSNPLPVTFINGSLTQTMCLTWTDIDIIHSHLSSYHYTCVPHLECASGYGTTKIGWRHLYFAGEGFIWRNVAAHGSRCV